ncbi:hypothetical protein AX774_g6411, partial [Zancudomyces culisetae]
EEDMDEEDRYGAVLRVEEKVKAGKYVPPYLRGKAEVGVKTGEEAQPNNVDLAANTNTNTNTNNNTNQTQKNEILSTEMALNALAKLNIKTIEPRISVNPISTTTAATLSSKSTTPTTSSSNRQPDKSVLSGRYKLEIEKLQAQGVLKVQRDLTKQISIAREDIKQQKRQAMRGHMEDLVRFSNSFVLNTPMPEHIKDIVEPKLVGLQQSPTNTALQTSTPTSTTTPTTTSTTANATSPPPPPPPAPSSPLPLPSSSSSVSISSKLNSNAPSFVPNPKAAVFVPKSIAKPVKPSRFFSTKPQVHSSPSYNILDFSNKPHLSSDPSSCPPTWPGSSSPFLRNVLNLVSSSIPYSLSNKPTVYNYIPNPYQSIAPPPPPHPHPHPHPHAHPHPHLPYPHVLLVDYNYPIPSYPSSDPQFSDPSYSAYPHPDPSTPDPADPSTILYPYPQFSTPSSDSPSIPPLTTLPSIYPSHQLNINDHPHSPYFPNTPNYTNIPLSHPLPHPPYQPIPPPHPSIPLPLSHPHPHPHPHQPLPQQQQQQQNQS